MTDGAKQVKGALQGEIDKIAMIHHMFSVYSEDPPEIGQCELCGIAQVLDGVQGGLFEVLGQIDQASDARGPDPETMEYLDHLKTENERLWKLVKTSGVADEAAA